MISLPSTKPSQSSSTGAFRIDGLDADADQNVLADPHRLVEAEGLGQIDGAGAGQVGADHGRAERGGQQAVGDAAAIGGLRGEGLVHMDRVEIVRSLGEMLDALLGDEDVGLRRHADVEFLEDIAARGMFRDEFSHDAGLA